MRKTSLTVMVIFLKGLFWKLLDRSYFPSSFSMIMSIFTIAFCKTPCSWSFHIHGSTYVLILSSKRGQTLWNKNRHRCLGNYHLQKNQNLHFKERCTKIDDISLIFTSFFFSQIKLGFKFNLLLISILDNFRHNLLIF